MVDDADGAVEKPRFERLGRRLPDNPIRFFDADLEQTGRFASQIGPGGLSSRRDYSALILALVGNDIESDGGAQIDDDDGLFEAVVAGGGIGEAVGSDFIRVGIIDGDRQFDMGADGQRFGLEVFPGRFFIDLGQVRHH
jgi:hypothetical protein